MKKIFFLPAAGLLAAAVLTIASLASGAGVPEPDMTERTSSITAGITRNLENFLAQENGEVRLNQALDTIALQAEVQGILGSASSLTQARVKEIEEREAASPYANVAISQVHDFVNIRKEPNTSAEVLGKIYNNSAATIKEKVDGEDGEWYLIKSGTVTGYIKAEFFLTGTKAEEIAKKVGEVYAVTNTSMLRLREKPSKEAKTLTFLGKGEKFQVKKEGLQSEDGTEFVELIIDEGDDGTVSQGYVAAQYVDISVKFKQAISIEEERAEKERQERLKREAEEARKKAEEAKRKEEERKKAEEASRKAEESKKKEKQKKATQAPVVLPPSDSSNSVRDAIVKYAVQFVGNPYKFGGTSLTGGADCSGFVQSVYAAFGYRLPRNSRSQASGGRSISASQIRPGDLVFFCNSAGTINHVAMYIGNNQIIHAQSTRTGIVISTFGYRAACKYVSYLP